MLTPVMIVGFLTLAASGTLLFSVEARPLWANPVIQVKAALIVFGIANALLFRVLWNRRLADWDTAAPAMGRILAGLSFIGWLSVAICGRFIGHL